MSQKSTIMVVEDEQMLLDAIKKKLVSAGYDVILFQNGREAIKYILEDKPLPDGVWLDYYLKDLNGLEFMTALKQKPEWAKVPVIVVSNSASPDKVHNMLALGVKKYFLKAEYRLEEIIKVLQTFIDEEK